MKNFNLDEFFMVSNPLFWCWVLCYLFNEICIQPPRKKLLLRIDYHRALKKASTVWTIQDLQNTIHNMDEYVVGTKLHTKLSKKFYNKVQQELDKRLNDIESTAPTTIVDDCGNKWCGCEQPHLTTPGVEGKQALCLNCMNYWYN